MMAERAHPDYEGFQNKIQIRWRKRIIPWVTIKKSPFREALISRYKWVQQSCRGRDVLDIPCGMGWGTSFLRGYKSLTGIDISEEAIQEAKKRYGKKAEFRVGSMDSLSFPDNSFDIVVCLEGIEHVPCEVGRTFLKEANRILRENGYLFLSSPSCRNGEHSGNEFHIYEYQPQEIEELLSAWFNIEAVKERDVGKLLVHYFKCRKK